MVVASLCSGADFLQQIVHGAIPKVYLETNSSVPANEISVHILDHLYKKLNEICPVQGGEVVKFPGLLVSLLFFCACLTQMWSVSCVVHISGGCIPDATLYICWKSFAIY